MKPNPTRSAKAKVPRAVKAWALEKDGRILHDLIYLRREALDYYTAEKGTPIQVKITPLAPKRGKKASRK